MEQLALRYPGLIALIWILLNLLVYLLYLLRQRIKPNITDFSPKPESETRKRSFLRGIAWSLLWIGFGTGIILSYKQAILQNVATSYEYFGWVGGFFFVEFGLLIVNLWSIGDYYICRKEMPEKMLYSTKTLTILSSIPFFAFSILIFFGFLMSKSPFLLGGSIGLAGMGVVWLERLVLKKNEKPPAFFTIKLGRREIRINRNKLFVFLIILFCFAWGFLKSFTGKKF